MRPLCDMANYPNHSSVGGNLDLKKNNGERRQEGSQSLASSVGEYNNRTLLDCKVWIYSDDYRDLVETREPNINFEIVIFYIEKSCFVVFFHEWNECKNPQLNFLSQNLSIECNFFKWDGKVTKIKHLLLHRIWKKYFPYFETLHFKKNIFSFNFEFELNM